jgi:hypothetical protein
MPDADRAKVEPGELTEPSESQPGPPAELLRKGEQS